MPSAEYFKKLLSKLLGIIVLIMPITAATFAQSTILFNNGAQVYTGPTDIFHLNGSFIFAI